jgi:hypothetical protein
MSLTDDEVCTYLFFPILYVRIGEIRNQLVSAVKSVADKLACRWNNRMKIHI